MEYSLIKLIENDKPIQALEYITSGSKLDEVDDDGKTALIIACEMGMSEVAVALIETGKSKPDAFDNTGRTALIIACETEMPKVALELIKNVKPETVGHVDDDGYTALINACKASMANIALALIDTGHSNPGQVTSRGTHLGGRTALIHACDLDMPEVALALIRTRDSNPTQVDDAGNTALSFAQEQGDMLAVVELLLQVAPPVAHVEVNPLQVHQAAAKINYEKLNEFFSTRIQPITIPQDYGVYIKDTINTLIVESDADPAKKQELTAGVQSIYKGRLQTLKYNETTTKLLRDSIINSLEYVKLQSPVFKQVYVEAFVQDCLHAYEGAAGMTCANGALERIIFSLVPACKTSDNPDYTTLIIIISAPELIINSIMDWHKSHNPKNVGAVAFPENTEREVKKADLRDYLLRLYPALPELIEQLIKSHAEELGYGDADFVRGGKSRNSRKRRKRRINKTRKKSYKKKVTKGYKKVTKRLQKKLQKVTKKLQKSYKKTKI